MEDSNENVSLTPVNVMTGKNKKRIFVTNVLHCYSNNLQSIFFIFIYIL